MTAVLIVGLLVAAAFLFARNPVAGDAPGHCTGATTEMGTKLSYEDILTLAQNAGFGCDAPTAAAIALAESGGDPQAYNPEKNAHLGAGYHDAPDGEGSMGLWQISIEAHPEFNCQDLTDPQVNANAAYSVYAVANGFSPWSTYKSGAYQDFLSA